MLNMKSDYINDGYYHISNDIKRYPEAWLYVVWSRRGPGKTYSLLYHSYFNHIKLLYMKRTNDDVKLICSYKGGDFDPSPYVPINRDCGTNIHPKKINEGIGAFYNYNIDDECEGDAVSYILSMNAIKKFKGFDFSDCEWMCLDEFIPQIGERINHREGEMLLDLYMTVARDRQKRGRSPLKLILFANAENISTPVTSTLEIIDDMAELNATGESFKYLEERGILIHHITDEEYPLLESEMDGIYKGMLGTTWHKKAFGGNFANNDFTNVKKVNLKNYKCLAEVKYKSWLWYIYVNPDNGNYYMCDSKHKAIYSYDLSRDNDVKRFYNEVVFDLKCSCIDERAKFQKYSMYDLILNYTKMFKI